jgi:hypothetical protein
MVPTPPSTLLPPETASLPLSLSTLDATTCRWDTSDVPFPAMANQFSGSTTQHATTLVGLSGGLSVSVFYVRCAAYADALVLAYRSLPDSGSAPFPRLGNLWGNYNFQGHPEGLAYAAARASLWLGASWTPEETAQLRALNPFTLVLTSVNACEVNAQDLPDDFYLTNITQPPSTRGRLQSWPGSWRLDLTNPAVQQWQAALMYCLVASGGSGYGPHPGCTNASTPGLPYDGLFVDNVFMDNGASVNSRDIFGNPFYPLDRATGKVMVDFGERWRAGMANMVGLFRAMMPHAVLHGHAMDITDANISSNFNAISIGFAVPNMVESFTSFSEGLSLYDAWMTAPSRSPRVTMVESAVRLQLGYGYGFDDDLRVLVHGACENSHSDPAAPMPGIGNACSPSQPQAPGYLLPQTYLFARSEYQYFRFGLGFTLMGDGYFTHELGDSWHGQDVSVTQTTPPPTLFNANHPASLQSVTQTLPPPKPQPNSGTTTSCTCTSGWP